MVGKQKMKMVIRLKKKEGNTIESLKRRIHVKRIPNNPINEVHESDVVELDAGPLLVAVVRGRSDETGLLELRDCLSEQCSKNVLLISLGELDGFELWEELG